MTKRSNRKVLMTVKEIKNTSKLKTVRHAEYYEMQTKFDQLYKESKEGKSFNNLMNLIGSEDNIKLAYRNIKRNEGSYTAGVDKETISDIEEMTEQDFIQLIQQKLKWYTPKPVKRVNIPKAGNTGKTRPLGIPIITDRIVQQCIKQILEPICEAKFYHHSYGFRPDRSVEQAIARTYQLIQKSNLHYVVNVDIKSFFDNVNHSKLIKQMWSLGIRDKQLICVIKKMLKAPIIMQDGSITHPSKGTPQGGILSPLLANIVLNELDWWIASQWEKIPTRNIKDLIRADGHIDRGNIYRILRNGSNLKEMFIVRYADDVKILCRNHEDANRVLIALSVWIETRLKLEISPEKSGVTNVREQYTEFLGFKIKVHKKGSKYVVKSHMADKAIQIQKNKLKDQVKRMQHAKDQKARFAEINKYNAMVMGMQEYYNIATDITLDCRKTGREVDTVIRNRLDIKKEGNIGKGAIARRYKNSRQVRYFVQLPLAPIAYCQTSKPMNYKRNICRYTSEGRAEKHKPLGVDLKKLFRLMNIEPKGNRSIEYHDSRISLYAAQYGKCAVTGLELEIDEIHCHHIKPSKGDGYKNLVILHKDVHILVHATNENTIAKYLPLLTTKAMYQKVNKLRKEVDGTEIQYPA